MPACRIDPPSRCFQRHASSMKSATAAQHRAQRRAEPLGEIQPHGIAAGGHLGGRDAGGDHGVHQPRAVHVRRHARARAPRPARRSSLASGHTEPPPRLAVCSTSTSVCGGELRRFSRNAARSVSASNCPRGPFSPSTEAPVSAAGPPPSLLRMCAVSCARISSPGRQCVEDRNLVAHGARRQEHRRLLAEQRRHAVAQRVHGGIVAVLLVAQLGRHHRRLHRRRRARLGVGIEVDAHRRQQRVGPDGRVGHGGPLGRRSPFRDLQQSRRRRRCQPCTGDGFGRPGAAAGGGP